MSCMSTTQVNPFPTMIKKALHLALLNASTQQNTPFSPKAPSILATNLIKSYFDKGLFREACKVFDEMPERDVVTWTAMIAGYASCSLNVKAWSVFYDMTRTGISPNEFTVSTVLKACKGMESLPCGTLAHGLSIKNGTDGFIYVENALMDMYATCCANMDEACSIFCCIQLKNAVSWTTMITGYTHRGDAFRALQVFKQMLLEEDEVNPYSFSIAVRACALMSSHAVGKQIHAAVVKQGFELSLPVTNSILDMYCKWGCLLEANKCFRTTTQKDLITWNTLIAGYQKVDSKESLSIFFQMGQEGYSPNCFTLTSIIAACANLAVLRCGQQVHGGIFRRVFDKNLVLGNALIDMYAKCGSITDARKIFNEMSCKNLVSWTSMMIGYGAHGSGPDAVELFDEMVRSGIRPDRIVLMAVLSACSHAGLLDQGLKYFNSMTSDYNITPDQEIYGCVVDLLGRAGRVNEAYQFIHNMPFEPDASIWGALLGACKAHKILKLGKLAALQVLDLKPNKVGTLVMLSNIYAAEGKWGETAKTRKLIKAMGNKKEAARSWIEVREHVYSFVIADKMCPQRQSIYEVVESLIWQMKEAGYVPDLDSLIYDHEDGT